MCSASFSNIFVPQRDKGLIFRSGLQS